MFVFAYRKPQITFDFHEMWHEIAATQNCISGYSQYQTF